MDKYFIFNHYCQLVINVTATAIFINVSFSIAGNVIVVILLPESIGIGGKEILRPVTNPTELHLDTDSGIGINRRIQLNVSLAPHPLKSVRMLILRLQSSKDSKEFHRIVIKSIDVVKDGLLLLGREPIVVLRILSLVNEHGHKPLPLSWCNTIITQALRAVQSNLRP